MKRKVLAIEVYQHPTSKPEALDDLSELERLIDSAGWQLAGSEVYQLRQMNYHTGLGKGKLADLKKQISEISSERNKNVDLIVLDAELKPYQIKNIEDFFNIEVSDRTRLILEIFKRRAKSAEGKLQVELAEVEYEIGRLVGGKGLELSRLGGGIGTRGPGEKVMEKERRAYERKITTLKKKLQKLGKNRARQNERRKNQGYPLVSLVGYTNAGKSTLLNALTKSNDVKVRDELFTTVDPTTRLVWLGQRQQPLRQASGEHPDGYTLVTDTVGFIRKLPHELVEGFESTLEQVTLSDLVLVVVDLADEQFQAKEANVFQTLAKIGCSVPVIKVYNKFDLVDSKRKIDPEAIYISASEHDGLEELRTKIRRALLSR